MDRVLYRQLIESSPDGIWVFDPDGRTVYANARTAELLGRTPEEMRTLSVPDVLDEAGKAQFAEHLHHLRTVGPIPTDVECCYLRKDGTPVLVVVGEGVITDDDGAVIGYVHRLTPDGERRALIEELSRSRQQLDEAQAIAGVGSWELDLTTMVSSWSRQLYAVFGLDPASPPTPETMMEYVVDADRPSVIASIEMAYRGEDPTAIDYRMRAPDGSVRWLRGVNQLTLGPDGTPVSVGGTVQDITDLKEVELQLVDAVVLNALMQVIATTANESETLADALDVTRTQLLQHDDWCRAVAFTVVPERDGIGLDPLLLGGQSLEMVPNDHERAVAERVLAGGEVVFEEESRPQNPSIGFPLKLREELLAVAVITARSPFERHDMLRSMVGQVTSQLARVAERERTAGELAAARDAAMEASRLKSEFLATMSHEIRTPMNGVIGLNELMLRTDLSHYQRRLAQGTQAAGQALLALINDILDFSKIEAGQLELESVEFEVRPVLGQVSSILSPAARDKGIGLVLDVAPGVPEQVAGDPTRLGQVVSNLASNAIKFTHQGEVVIHVDVREQDDSTTVLRVAVTDTGIGIPADQLDRLFEPFQQADVTTTREFGGTGLGLAISRQLVHALGGQIGVSSRPGEGSTFWFTGRFGSVEPARRSEAGAPLVQPGDTRRAGHVLVVEDNEINQMVALGLLETLGYSADVADNGMQAVVKALSSSYDAVLMDLQMPRMDGYTAARRIRASEPLDRRVPIIAMTASAVVGERERCLAAGMDDFLTKPVDSGRLETVLRAHVSGASVCSWPRVSASAPDEGPLDVRRLEELTTLGERAVAVILRAIDNFDARMPEVLAELDSAVSAQDGPQLRALAHRLKGSALNLGAGRVAQVCGELEALGEQDAVSAAKPLLPELRSAADAAIRALGEYRAGAVTT